MSFTKFNEFINESKKISIKKLYKIAQEAGETVIDAKDELLELGVAYGNQIPVDRVKEILANYDMEDLMESVNENDGTSMFIKQLEFIKYASDELIEWFKDGSESEEWFESKLSEVFSQMKSLHAYMEGSKRSDDDDEYEETHESTHLAQYGFILIDPKNISQAVKFLDKFRMRYSTRLVPTGGTEFEFVNQKDADQAKKIIKAATRYINLKDEDMF